MNAGAAGPAAGLVSIQVGRPRDIDGDAGGGAGEIWTSGIFKTVVTGRVFVGREGVTGDGQADRVAHGGPDKAVCVYVGDHYVDWRKRPELAAMGPGAFGENFTISGLDEQDVCVGDRWRVGGLLVEISQPRQPCWKLARRWGIPSFADEVVRSGRTGWYLRVHEEGFVEAGDAMTLVERPWPEWTIADANRVMHGRPRDAEGAARLAAVPALSTSWRTTLGKRAVRHSE